ncbi:MAG: DegT/DnrJ/EryC1/StrS aminotransferase family protein [Acidobacteriaceae bacterium]|nr:DegT/DnrJ/EryC1/StrS aminotransferase family protein [Acidobacteriaceae bacterium]
MRKQIKRLVSAFPEVDLTHVIRSPKQFAHSLSEYTRIYTAGRDAIFFACRGLRLEAGVPVWLPSFHCGVEVQAILDAGAVAGFYRIRPDLSVDENDLLRKLDAQPGPVLLIHYFGFPQPGTRRIAAQCSARKIPLIEDCAHALFSRHEGTPLGDFASIAIYSFRKTLPVYDGGGLRVQQGRIPAESSRGFECPELSSAADGLMRLFKDLGRRTAGPMLTRLYRRARFGAESRSREQVRANTVIPEVRSYGTGISKLSRRIASQADPLKIVESRRRNWSALAARVQAPKVFSCLGEGICPLFFPIWVKNRAKVIATLADSGVETFVFGEFAHPLLPLDEYPETKRMRDDILCLPLHQRLRPVDLRYAGAALERALSPL